MNSQEQTTSGPDVEHVVRELASWERPSASAGERRAAEWIAEQLRELGVDQVRIEEEPAHGGYWWPFGMLRPPRGWRRCSADGWSGPSWAPSRRSASGTSSACVAASGRAFVRRRTTRNVVAEFGPRDARVRVVIIAHHERPTPARSSTRR